jgi:hypothetical protein
LFRGDERISQAGTPRAAWRRRHLGFSSHSGIAISAEAIRIITSMKSMHKLTLTFLRLGGGGAAIVLALALTGCACCPKAAPDAEAAAQPLSPAPPAATDEWIALFDGKSLKDWTVTDFAGHGDVEVRNGEIILAMGAALTGIHWTNEAVLPKTNYEIALEAKRIDGQDFFCGLTVPVADSHCSLIVGGWGGTIVGISSLDHMDASENETTKFLFFEPNQWYPIRMRVTPDKLQAWIEDEKMIDVDIKDRKVEMRPGEIEDSRPLGVATYQTTAALRNIRLRRLPQ